jgi:esterase/lipase
MTLRIVGTLVAAGLLLFLCPACAHTPYWGALDRSLPPPALARPEIAAFAYARTRGSVELEKLQDESDYTICKVKFRVLDFAELRAKVGSAFYFAQKKPGKSPVLLCLPQTGGPMSLVKGFAEYYAQHGFTTMAFYRREGFFNPAEDLEYNVDLIRQSVIDVRRAIDFLQTQPEADPDRIAVMGVSLGGIIAALATEADGRIKATGMLVSAGDLPLILEKSHYERVVRFRNGMMKRCHLDTCDDLVHFAQASMRQVDPATYADRVDPARLLMINGYQDNIINIHAALETWKAFGKPEWRTLPVGHYSSFALVDLARRWTLEHFQRVLGAS